MEKAEILSSMFAMKLDRMEPLRKALPEAWLVPNAALSGARQATEKRLLDLRAKATLTVAERDELNLLVLQIQWLKLGAEARNKYLSEIETRQVASASQEKGDQLIQEANKEVETAVSLEQDISELVRAARDNREAFLLGIRLSLEQEKIKLAGAKKHLGEIQQGLAAKIAEWNALEAEIVASLESQDGSFIRYRSPLRQRLKESNQRVISRESFEKYALVDIQALSVEIDVEEIVSVNGDTEPTKQLIQAIHESAINLTASYELFSRERNLLLINQIEWERNYRQALLNARGRLISKLKRSDALIEGGEPLLQEGRTIFSSSSFSIWSFKPLYLDSRQYSEKTLSQRVGEYGHVLRVLIPLLITIVLLVKKKSVVGRLQAWINRHLFKKHLSWRQWGTSFFSDLYVFFVLLFLGGLIIELGVSFGFPFLAGLKPIFNITLYFFFGWGVTKFIQPIVSQRRFQRNVDRYELDAMEEIFAFFPKLLLVYFLVSSLSQAVLHLWLRENFISEYLVMVYQWMLLVSLFAGVWIKRNSWRLISAKAVRSPRIDQMVTQSKDKPWEPLLLLLAGGLGVYLMAWRLIKNRIGEFEITRSFQAMVSRALLERRKSRSTVRVFQERFPDGYLAAFNYETRAMPSWHVEKKESLEQLEAAYERWNNSKQGTTVLITGDRGVGKSELIYHFLRNREMTAVECRLKPSDTDFDTLLETLSVSIAGKAIVDGGDGLVAAINAMEPSVIVLENLENSILRQVDGFDSFIYVVDLIMATSGRHLWLTTFTTYAWTIAKRAVPGADCFAQYIYLHGMNEEEIKQLVVRRHQSQQTTELDFSSLSLEGDASRRKKSVSLDEKVLRQQKLYFRILWDYTGGNPRQALYFWKTSINFNKSITSVSLFDIPEQSVLENLRDKSLMLLAALVEHNGLTLEGLETVLNEPRSVVRRWIEEMTPYGIIYSFGDSDSTHCGWHVESFWISIVEAYLEKRQLLFRGGSL